MHGSVIVGMGWCQALHAYKEGQDILDKKSLHQTRTRNRPLFCLCLLYIPDCVYGLI